MSTDRTVIEAATFSPPWRELLVVHESWLRKVIQARTGERQSVDDVFQQLAVAALEQQAPVRDETKFAPWLHRVAIILSVRHKRTMGRGRSRIANLAQTMGSPPVQNGARNPLEWLLDRERKEHVRFAMERLAGRDQEILLLKYDERLSYQQIADRLGITEKAVDRRLARARQRLREELATLGIRGIES